MTIKEIRALTGLSQAKFCQKYHIPLNTLTRWEQGKREPPDYLVELLEFKVREDLGMKGMKLTLTEVLDYFDSLTKVKLYVNRKEVKNGTENIYSYPDRHDLNQFYGCEIEEIKPIGDKLIEIYIKCDNPILIPDYMMPDQGREDVKNE